MKGPSANGLVLLRRSGRELVRPLQTREIAAVVCQCDGKEAQDRRLLGKVTLRVGETLRKMKVVALGV